MADALIHYEDHYVWLEPGQPEAFLSPDELLDRLESLLARDLDSLTPDVLARGDRAAQARYLRDTVCELELEPGRSVQWFAVRLEKPARSAP
jgi:Protein CHLORORESPIRATORY REDUCTION 7